MERDEELALELLEERPVIIGEPERRTMRRQETTIKASQATFLSENPARMLRRVRK